MKKLKTTIAVISNRVIVMVNLSSKPNLTLILSILL